MGPQSGNHLSLSLGVIAAMVIHVVLCVWNRTVCLKVKGCPPLGRGGGDTQPEHVTVTLLGPVWPVILQRISEAAPAGIAYLAY